MSEEGESINENINLSSEKEAAPEVLKNESEVEESLGGQDKQLEAAAIEQPQSGTINQIRSQVNQIQKRISLLYKSVQKRSTGKLQSGKKISRNKKKNNIEGHISEKR